MLKRGANVIERFLGRVLARAAERNDTVFLMLEAVREYYEAMALYVPVKYEAYPLDVSEGEFGWSCSDEHFIDCTTARPKSRPIVH